MNVQHKAAILIGCALCWTFIGLAILCYAYAGYVILRDSLTQRVLVEKAIGCFPFITY